MYHPPDRFEELGRWKREPEGRECQDEEADEVIYTAKAIEGEEV